MSHRISSFLVGLSLLFFASAQATTYVPISVGDITVIIPIDDPPKAASDTITVDEDSTTELNFLTNDWDEKLDQVEVVIVSPTDITSLNGTLLQSGKTLTYTPASNEHGNNYDYFSYYLRDVEGNESETVTVTLHVNSVNDAPKNVQQEFEWGIMEEDSSVTFIGLYGFEDVDGDSLTVISASSPQGSASIRHGSDVTFYPTAHYYGHAALTIIVSDGTDTARVLWNFNIQSRPDETDVNSFVMISDSGNTQTGMYITDPDGLPQEVTMEVTGDHDFYKTITVYQCLNPRPPHTCYYAFMIDPNMLDGTYVLNVSGLDESGNPFSDDPKTFVVGVGNYPPEAVDDNFEVTVGESSTELLNVIGNDYDPNGDALTIDDIVQFPTQGTISIENNQVRYTPNNVQEQTSDTLKYKISDGRGGYDEAEVVVDLKPFVLPPVTDLTMSVGSQVNLTRATVVEGREVTFNWTRDEAHGSNIEYRFGIKSESANCPDGKPSPNSCIQQSEATSYSMYAVLPGGTSYTVHACIKNTQFCSASSNTVSVTVPSLQVTGLSASEYVVYPGTEVTTSWEPLSVANSYYIIEYDKPENPPVENWERLEADRRYTETSRTKPLHSLGTYRYRITGCSDDLGCHSEGSIVAIDVVPDLTISGLSVSETVVQKTQDETPQVTLSWTAIEEPTGVYYQVISIAPDGTETQVADELSTTSQDVSLTEVGTYTFKVKGCHTEYECSDGGNGVEVVVSELKIKLEYRYDALGRLIYVVDPINGDRNYELDAAGNRKNVSKTEGGN